MAQKICSIRERIKRNIEFVLRTSIARITWQQMKSAKKYDDFWLHFQSDLFFLSKCLIVKISFFCCCVCVFFFLLIQSQFNKMNYPYHRRKSFYYLILKHLLWLYHLNWSNSLRTFRSHYYEKMCSSTVFHNSARPPCL